VELTQGWSPVLVWVHVEITDEFILGLDILHTYGAFMYLRHHVLQLGQEEL
jgi:hypothetical protein